MKNFTHYSLLRGFSKPHELAKICADNDYPACGITDYKSISGAVSFHQACKKVGIKPIIGCSFDNTTVYAKNKDGWHDLIQMVSMTDENGNMPLKNTLVEIWQCDENQHYDNTSDDYVFRGAVKTGEDGKYYFKDPYPRPEVYDTARIPKGGYQKENVSPEVWHLINEFDKTYSELVRLLEDAWAENGGGQASLVKAIEVMFKLERYALPLIQTPIPGSREGLNYGPCFRIIDID